MFVTAVRVIVGLVSVFFLFFVGVGATEWWERRPTHYPSMHLHVLFFHWTWTAPESLKAQLDVLKAAEAAAAKRAVAVAAAQKTIGEQTTIKVHDETARIEFVTRTITKEIPIHVTAQIDADYPLSVGWVRVHDAAASGFVVSAVPGPAGAADDARSRVPSSDASRAIAANYGDCRADAAEVTGWQDWYGQISAAANQGRGAEPSKRRPPPESP